MFLGIKSIDWSIVGTHSCWWTEQLSLEVLEVPGQDICPYAAKINTKQIMIMIMMATKSSNFEIFSLLWSHLITFYYPLTVNVYVYNICMVSYNCSVNIHMIHERIVISSDCYYYGRTNYLQISNHFTHLECICHVQSYVQYHVPYHVQSLVTWWWADKIY